MKDEKQLYQLLRKILPGDFLRVENGVAAGVPDINICYKGVEVWIEAKLVLPQGVLLRKFQYSWGRQRSYYEGRVFLVAWNEQKQALMVWPWILIDAVTCGKYLAVKSSPDRIFFQAEWPDLKDYIFYGTN